MQESPPETPDVVTSAEPTELGDPSLREIERLEELLGARVRQQRSLERELARRSTLLRQAAARLEEQGAIAVAAAAPPDGPLDFQDPPDPHALRASGVEAASPQDASQDASQDSSQDASQDASPAQGPWLAARDAAIARALDAQARCAELAFRLDEALGHLHDASVSDATQAELEGTARGLRARIVELEEALGMAEARHWLATQDLADVRQQSVRAERAVQESSELLELEIVRARGDADAQRTLIEHAIRQLHAVRGERDGARARRDEAERAFDGLRVRAEQAAMALIEARDKLAEVRSDRAALFVAGEARSAQVLELVSERDAASRDARDLRAELERRDATLQANERTSSARAAEVEALADRLRMLEAQRAQLTEAASERQALSRQLQDALARAEALRAFVQGVRAPLFELSSALQSVGQRAATPSELPAAPRVAEEPSLTGGAAAPAPEAGGAAASAPASETGAPEQDALDEQLRASERRVQELESMLAGRMSARDVGLSSLKGELIDVRASAARLSDDLARERARRRKISVGVRALQAVIESGENPAPWLEELIVILNDGATLPPPAGS